LEAAENEFDVTVTKGRAENRVHHQAPASIVAKLTWKLTIRRTLLYSSIFNRRLTPELRNKVRLPIPNIYRKSDYANAGLFSFIFMSQPNNHWHK
jgi:hypothetical protein